MISKQADISFHQDIDQAFFWIKHWGDSQVFDAIKALLWQCSVSQLQFLQVVLEPLLHRDFLYHNFNEPSFAPLSTYVNRELFARLEKNVNKNFKNKSREFMQSVTGSYIKNEGDANVWTQQSVLPYLKDTSSKTKSSQVVPLLNTQSVSSIAEAALNSFYSLQNLLDADKGPAGTSHPVAHGSTIVDGTEPLKLKHTLNNRRSLSRSRMQLFAVNSDACFMRPSSISKSGDGSHACDTEAAKVPSLLAGDVNHRCSACDRHSGRCDKKERILRLPGKGGLVFHDDSQPLTPVRRHIQDIYEKERMKCLSGDLKLSSHESTPVRIAKKLSPDFPGRSRSCPIPAYACGDKNFRHGLRTIMTWFSDWTGFQQEYFLRGFIKLLQKSQLYYMTAILMIKLHCDFISLLPEELSLRIFKFLSARQLLLVSRVCLKWKELASHDSLWEAICKKDEIDYERGKPWKRIYFEYNLCRRNWVAGWYSMKELRGHSASVTAVRCCGEVIASGSADKTIRIWDLSTEKCILVLEGHQRTVWALRFVTPTLLISCSADGAIKIWNLRTAQCLRTIVTHDGAVWCMEVRRDYLVSGGADKMAKIWSLRVSSSVASFSGHPGGVYSVDLTDDCQTLLTGSSDGTVRLWSVPGRVCFLVIRAGGSFYPVSALSYCRGFLLAASYTTLSLWNLKNESLVAVKELAHSEKIEAIQLEVFPPSNKAKRFGRCCSVAKDGRLKFWDSSSDVNMKVLHSASFPGNTLLSLHLQNSLLVAGSADMSVKVFDFSKPR